MSFDDIDDTRSALTQQRSDLVSSVSYLCMIEGMFCNPGGEPDEFEGSLI